MKTISLILTLAALFTAQVINADVPTPTAYAGQYDGGVIVWCDPVVTEGGASPELYYFWRDGAMIGWGTEPVFIDYPSREYHVYGVQVSFSGVRGELSEVAVGLSEPVAVEPPSEYEVYE